VEIGLGLKQVPPIRYRKLSELGKEVGSLLGTFCHLAGHSAALEMAAKEYREHTGNQLQIGSTGLPDVADALMKMDSATPLVKQQILRLSGLVVVADKKIEEAEVELLRATAEAIGVPIPPWIRITP
jgi:hypothetical protein